jgi:hypothetical protein
MPATFIPTHGTKDDTFVACAGSPGIVFEWRGPNLDAALAPHATCGDTTKP